jgi:hypothetical protein
MTSSLFRTPIAEATGSVGRLFFTSLFRRYRLSTLFTGAEAFYTLRGFLFDKQWVVACRTFTRHWLEIDNELAIRVAIAGIEGFAVSGTALHQMSALTLRAGNGGIVRLINQLGMFTLRILTTTDKHTKTPLP